MQSAEVTSTTENKTKASIAWARYLLLSALALLLIWAGMKAWAIGGAVQSLRDSRVQAETMLAQGITNADPDEVESLVMQVRSDVLTLKGETAFLMPLLSRLDWAPRYGALLAATPHFVEMADAGTEAAAYAVRGLKPTLSALQNDPVEERIPAIVQAIAAARPDLVQTAVSIERVVAARAEIENVAQMPENVGALLHLTDEWLPHALDGLAFAQVLPQFMGSEGTRRYLIMAQNEDEIRPTGGFITGGGILELENGRILSLDFMDSYQVDNFREKPYEAPPQQLESLMGFELFLFRDTNFWPDFPTSAETAMSSFSYGQDAPELDGAIAIDQRFLQLLLQGTGSVEISDADVTLTSDNVIDTLRDAWARDEDEDIQGWLGQRKSFFGSFATAILNKVQSDFESIQPVQFAQSMFEALETKRLQIYARDPAVAAVLDELNWDGRLENNGGQDFLSIIDTNVGFNKTDLYIRPQINYSVTLAQNGGGSATVTLKYTHQGSPKEGPCIQTGPSYENPDYLEVANSCYWSYVRLYAPASSDLLSSTETNFTSDAMFRKAAWRQSAQPVNDVNGFSTFANLLMIPHATTMTFDFTYQLPQTITQSHDGLTVYRLHLHKQAGRESIPTQVTIILPDGAQHVEISPSPAKIDGTRIQFVLDLMFDQLITISYR